MTLAATFVADRNAHRHVVERGDAADRTRTCHRRGQRTDDHRQGVRVEREVVSTRMAVTNDVTIGDCGFQRPIQLDVVLTTTQGGDVHDRVFTIQRDVGSASGVEAHQLTNVRDARSIDLDFLVVEGRVGSDARVARQVNRTRGRLLDVRSRRRNVNTERTIEGKIIRGDTDDAVRHQIAFQGDVITHGETGTGVHGNDRVTSRGVRTEFVSLNGRQRCRQHARGVLSHQPHEAQLLTESSGPQCGTVVTDSVGTGEVVEFEDVGLGTRRDNREAIRRRRFVLVERLAKFQDSALDVGGAETFQLANGLVGRG